MSETDSDNTLDNAAHGSCPATTCSSFCHPAERCSLTESGICDALRDASADMLRGAMRTMTDTASPLPFTLSSHDDAPTRGGSLLATMPCSGSLDLRLGDCMEGMKTFPDGYFDLAIVDPPYGLGETAKRSKQRVPKTQSKKWKNRRAPEYGGSETWDDNPPPPEYFLELKRVSRNQIIWGANHFGMMPPSSGWIVWHKKRHDEKNDFSDAELAWSSMQKGCRLFHMPWIGFGAVNAGESRIHPTQKPVKLYSWLLANYAKTGMRVLDTHMGSGSIAIAAHYAGIHLTAFEIDPDYYQAAKARIARETSQAELFSPQNSILSSLDHQ